MIIPMPALSSWLDAPSDEDDRHIVEGWSKFMSVDVQIMLNLMQDKVNKIETLNRTIIIQQILP
jgi:hypothetical protein